ncbi:hypothetical protein P171DRAFT_449458 [Karstenula rhodostoma CBS 690.94]|uniref:Uncharacterized protein n=1 Tax=Karstenula rhodostoma CBS 690.94 TaxID=1392251 RepID=A0A9P4U6L5_9PLEO|nr:hypothetical protein P171DRAFT_449458 [Karstenula rhodostoma CBS 690.94]
MTAAYRPYDGIHLGLEYYTIEQVNGTSSPDGQGSSPESTRNQDSGAWSRCQTTSTIRPTQSNTGVAEVQRLQLNVDHLDPRVIGACMPRDSPVSQRRQHNSMGIETMARGMGGRILRCRSRPSNDYPYGLAISIETSDALKETVAIRERIAFLADKLPISPQSDQGSRCFRIHLLGGSHQCTSNGALDDANLRKKALQTATRCVVVAAGVVPYWCENAKTTKQASPARTNLIDALARALIHPPASASSPT